MAPPSDDVDRLAARAEQLLAASQWDEGLAMVHEALRANPERVHGLLHLEAVALQNLGRWEAAIASARSAVLVAPDDPSGHYLLAKGLWHEEHDSEALAAIERAIALEPYAPLYRYTLARFVFDEDPRRAEELLERIVADEPTRADALNDLGVLRELRGDRDGARALYERALRAEPSMELARWNRDGVWSPFVPYVGGAFVLALVGGAPLVGALAARRAGHPILAGVLALVAALGLLLFGITLVVRARVGRERRARGPRRTPG